MTSSQSPIDRLIQGINTAKLELMLSSFASDAEIVDDGKSFTGDAIKLLCENGLLGHHARVQVLGQELQADGRTFTHIMMGGDFGKEFGIHEPFELFLVARAHNDKIQHLDMGDVDPRKPTIRAVYASVANVSDPLASVRINKRNLPEPREGWVRVKMEAVALNFHDLFTLRGLGIHEVRFPMILGNEGAGVLDDGTEVTIYPAMGDPDFKGDETLDPKRHVFGELVQGTLAEYTMVPKRNAVPRPKGMDANTASVMGIAWLTAYRMLFTQAKLRAGQTVLVQGSSGGKYMLAASQPVAI